MTIIEAINRIDDIKPNIFTQEHKIGWLGELDGKIKTQVIDTHEGGDDIEFDGYTEADLSRELIVKAPYDGIYISWLEAQIDYADHETARYENSSAMFNAQYSEWERYYNRTHMPLGVKYRFF